VPLCGFQSKIKERLEFLAESKTPEQPSPRTARELGYDSPVSL
jgi:hypothetical protein